MLYRLLFFTLPHLFILLACIEATTDRERLSATTYSIDEDPDTAGSAVATFAGGCFWCTEAYFERLHGVKKVISGYAGGRELNPTYEQVSYGRTGHAECVQVYYDPEIVTYQELLEVFFATHDPTTLNRQGPDVGKQYRSVVFYHNQEQQKLARQYMQELSEAGIYKNRIVTKLEPFDTFWEAEEYHQDYYIRNPNDPYVQRVARPKVKKFEDAFRSRLKSNQNN